MKMLRFAIRLAMILVLTTAAFYFGREYQQSIDKPAVQHWNELLQRNAMEDADR